MAPTRSSGGTKSSSLKQGTLSFASTKRTASTSTAGKPKKVAKNIATTSSESAFSTPEKSPSSSSVEDVAEIQPSKPLKRVKEGQVLRPAKRRHVSPVAEVLEPKPQPLAVEEVKDERPRLNIKDRRWISVHAAAKKRMEYANPIYSENQNKIHEILRVFDLSYEYGPCVGVTRLERWERAQAMGLNPPEEIREILNTIEGMDKEEYSQSVFYGEV